LRRAEDRRNQFLADIDAKITRAAAQWPCQLNESANCTSVAPLAPYFGSLASGADIEIMASAKLGALHRAVIEINQRPRFFLSPSNNSCTAVPTIGHGTPIALDGAVEIFLL
jgi:hypothetical protein